MRLFAATCLAASLLAAPALAQGVMTPGAMPPPPSAAEPRPKAEGTTTTKKPRAQRRAKTDATEAPARPSSAGGGYKDRIDTRRGDGPLELEDDPRAARPMMQNGRPGMGMRF